MFFGECFVKNSKGQGTIEYLVIIGVVIVISLVVVGLLVGFLDSGSSVSSDSSELAVMSSSIGVTESMVNSDGEFAVKLLNNTGNILTISKIELGGEEVLFSEDLAQGGSKYFVVDAETVCEEGKILQEDLVVTYVTRQGLTKTERYPSKVFFDCTPYTVNANMLADQCPFAVELHSGQTTSYDVGDLDDKEQDGTAKSYTADGCGGGTVLDNHTGLCWQKNHRMSGGTCKTVTWESGESALSYCSTLANGVDGLTDGSSVGDWRVPSFVELATLPDMSYPSSSYLNSVFTQTGWNSTCFGYWSSTTVPSSTGYAYYLNSFDGILSAYETSDDKFGVRCVRSES